MSTYSYDVSRPLGIYLCGLMIITILTSVAYCRLCLLNIFLLIIRYTFHVLRISAPYSIIIWQIRSAGNEKLIITQTTKRAKFETKVAEYIVVPVNVVPHLAKDRGKWSRTVVNVLARSSAVLYDDERDI